MPSRSELTTRYRFAARVVVIQAHEASSGDGSTGDSGACRRPGHEPPPAPASQAWRERLAQSRGAPNRGAAGPRSGWREPRERAASRGAPSRVLIAVRDQIRARHARRMRQTTSPADSSRSQGRIPIPHRDQGGAMARRRGRGAGVAAPGLRCRSAAPGSRRRDCATRPEAASGTHANAAVLHVPVARGQAPPRRRCPWRRSTPVRRSGGIGGPGSFGGLIRRSWPLRRSRLRRSPFISAPQDGQRRSSG
jgi:hypothetical protein